MSRPSNAAFHVLRLQQQGRDISFVTLPDGRGSQSLTVGRGNTIDLCCRKGWLVWHGRHGAVPEGQPRFSLTEAGLAALAAEDARMKEVAARARRKYLLTRLHWEKGDRCHGLWSNDERGAIRYGRVSIGPRGFWDGTTYRWAVDKPDSPGVFTHEGEAIGLKAAKAAVETIVAGGSL